jgi:hypothetical protein
MNLIAGYKLKLDNYTHSKINLEQKEAELILVASTNFTEIDVIQDRLKDLYQYIGTLNVLIKKCSDTIISYSQPLNGVTGYRLNQFQINKKKLQSKKIRSVVDLYESVFSDCTNTKYSNDITRSVYLVFYDYKTYPALWRKLLTAAPTVAQPVIDCTQIVNQLAIKQRQILESVNSGSKRVEDFELISMYYSRIIKPFVQNYTDLPQEYNVSNYGLTIVVDIIIHLVRRIIVVELFNILIKMLTKYLIALYPRDPASGEYTDNRTYQAYIEKILIGIIHNSPEVGTSRLLKFIFDILPKKVVKIILGIYEGENLGEDDLDRTLDVEGLFKHINKILMTNTTLTIESDSSLIVNLTDYVYPYFRDYLELFVREIKKMMDGYLRALHYQANNLELLTMLLSRAVSEQTA